MLKKITTTTKTRDAASAPSTVSKKVENVVDKVEPAAFSALSEKGPEAINNRLDTTASVCYIHDVEFRTLVEKHELSAGEGIN